MLFRSIEENFAASDASALVQVTQNIIYLEDGDCAEIRANQINIVDTEGKEIHRPTHLSKLTAEAVELGQYKNYMEKEINEQPMAIANTLELVTNSNSIVPELFGAEAGEIFKKIDSILILACGTSYHAGMVARYWLESLAGLPCNVEIASEYRYRESVVNKNCLVITISQSGETADTLAALNFAKNRGQTQSLAICNVPESALIRSSKLRFLTRAGPEIGVASTKAFTTQLATLILLSMILAKLRKRLDPSREAQLLTSLRHLPAALSHVLKTSEQIKSWADYLAPHHHALFLEIGRAHV